MENAGEGVFAVIILPFCNAAEMMKMRSIKREESICFGTRVLLAHLWFKCQQITSVPQKQSLDAGCVACFYHGIFIEVVSIEMWSVEHRCDKTPHSRRGLSRPQIVQTTRYSQIGNELPGFRLSTT